MNSASRGPGDWCLHNRSVHILRARFSRECRALKLQKTQRIRKYQNQFCSYRRNEIKNPDNFIYFQLKVCPKHYCLSTVGVRQDLFRRDPKTVPVTDFFGSLRPVELTTSIVNLVPVTSNRTERLEPERKLSYVAQFPDLTSYV